VEVMEDKLAPKQDIRDLETSTRAMFNGAAQNQKDVETGLKQGIKDVDTGLRQEISKLETSLRQEIRDVDTGLRQEIKKVEMSLRQEIKDLQNLLTLRMGAMFAATITFLTTVQIYLKR
jgi:hypothetical protein